ncbi:MAG TPA: hypothetical protein VF279_04030, partial [Acidimicrobiales bacterium]
MSDTGDTTADNPPGTAPEPPADGAAAPRHSHSHSHGHSKPPMSRRRFLGWAAGGALAAAAAAAIVEDVESGPPHTESAVHRPTGSTSTTTTTTTRPVVGDQSVVEGVSLPTSPAIITENARQGDAWWVTSPQAAGDIEGFADKVSAQVGDVVTLRVNTRAATFHVEAYRIGYYQGIGARRV